MKRIFLAILLPAVAVAMYSCVKDSGLPASNSSMPPAPPGNNVTPSGLNHLSQWKTLPVSLKAGRMSYWLEADYTLPALAGYIQGTHQHFAYIRIKGRDSWIPKAVPVQIATAEGTIDFSYQLTGTGFKVVIRNLDYPDRKPPFNRTTYEQGFRFLVITDSTFLAHRVDWTDYGEAARVLAPTIWYE